MRGRAPHLDRDRIAALLLRFAAAGDTPADSGNLVALYLVLVYALVFRSGLAHIRRNAVLQDDGRFLILLVTALGAFASIAAIVLELDADHRGTPELRWRR